MARRGLVANCSWRRNKMKVLGSVRPEGYQPQGAGERSGSFGAATLGTGVGSISLRAALAASAEAVCASSNEPPLAAEVLRNSRRFMPGIEPPIPMIGKRGPNPNGGRLA